MIRVYCVPKSNPTIMTKEGVVQYTRPKSNLSFAEVDLWETRKKRGIEEDSTRAKQGITTSLIKVIYVSFISLFMKDNQSARYY